MPESYSAEMYRQEDAESRSVHVSVREDGSMYLSAQGMGKPVKEFWGDHEYEFGVEIPATALRYLFIVSSL